MIFESEARRIEQVPFLDILRAREELLFNASKPVKFLGNEDNAENRMQIVNLLYDLENKDDMLIEPYRDHKEDLYRDAEDVIRKTDKHMFDNYRRAVAYFFAELEPIRMSKANFLVYLRDVRLKPYFFALEYYGLDRKPLDDLIDETASQAFARKKREAKKKNAIVPTSPVTNDLFQILTGDFTGFVPGFKGCTYHRWYEKKDGEILLHVNLTSREATYTVKDTATLSVDTVRIFVYLLMQTNIQAFNKYELREDHDYVTISDQDLVDAGLYTERKNAKTALEKSAKAIREISIDAIEIIYKKDPADGKKKKTRVKTQGGSYFYHYESDKHPGLFTFHINRKMNWEMLLKYRAIIPQWILTLRGKAFLLALEIFTSARGTSKSHFTIPLSKLQTALHLADQKGGRNPRDNLLIPIETAIQKVVTASLAFEPIEIETHYPENATVYQILANGYIEVTLSGEAQRYIEMRASKKKEAIEDKLRSEGKTEEKEH